MAAVKSAKLKVVQQVPVRGTLFAFARVPRSARLFVGGSDSAVSEVDLSAAKPVLKELGRHDSYVTGVALAGPLVVSGGYDGRLTWWDPDQRSRVRTVEAHRKWVRGVKATLDGKMLASVADDMVCRLWDGASGKLLHELRGHQERTPHHFLSMLYACALSPDGRHVATGDKVGHVVVWEAASGKALAMLETPGLYTWDPVQRRHSIGGIRSLAFSPDGKRLAVGGIGKIGNIDHLEGKPRVEVFDWEMGTRTHEFVEAPFKGLVEHLEWHPRGDWLLAAGGANDGFLMLLDLGTKKVVLQEKVPLHIHAAALDETGERVYTAGNGRIMTFALEG